MRTPKKPQHPQQRVAPTCELQFTNRAELSAYIDRELPAWKRHLIHRHLKRCAVCRAQFQQLRRTDDFLRRSDGVDVPDDFLTNVMARVSEQARQRPTHSTARYTGWIPRHSGLLERLRESVRTRSPVSVFVLTFLVFTMIGATLYQPASDRAREAARTQHQELAGEKLISFEVIPHEPPKRSLITYLQQR